MKRVLIAGVGNVLLGDDGVGPYVSCLMESRYAFQEGVSVEDLGTPGLDLVVHLSDADAIVIIDCVNDDRPVGTVTVFDRPEIVKYGTAIRVDGHSPALTESLMIAEFAAETPKQIVLVGISGKPSEGCELSPAVRSAVEKAIDEVLNQLDRWGVCYGPREVPAVPQIWWQQLAAVL